MTTQTPIAEWKRAYIRRGEIETELERVDGVMDNLQYEYESGPENIKALDFVWKGLQQKRLDLLVELSSIEPLARQYELANEVTD